MHEFLQFILNNSSLDESKFASELNGPVTIKFD